MFVAMTTEKVEFTLANLISKGCEIKVNNTEVYRVVKGEKSVFSAIKTGDIWTTKKYVKNI